MTTDVCILAGGKGRRLASVVSDRPKPMALVAGRPFLEWLILWVRRQGLRRVILSTGFMGEVVEAHFGDGDRFGMDFVYSRESTPLGTGGAVRHALPCFRSDAVIVMNGDSFCPVDFERLEQSHRERRACASLWLACVEDCSRYGSVAVGENGAVLAFREKAPGNRRPGLINAGVYVMDCAVASAVPLGPPVSLETDVFPGLVGRGLHAVSGEGMAPFIDIGTPEAYAIAHEVLAKYTQT